MIEKEYVLSFNAQRASAFRYVRFSSVEAKQAYVAAEDADLDCYKAWDNFHRASTRMRKHYAQVLDNVRFNFYQRWSEEQK